MSDTPPMFERGDHVELAERLVDEVRAQGEAVCDEGALFRYDESSGIWITVDRLAQSRIVQSFAGSAIAGEKKAMRLRANDVDGAIKLAAAQIGRPGFFADAPVGIAFTNGFVEVSDAGIRLTAHSPEHRARVGFPFPFDARRAAPRLLAMLDGVFRDDADRHEKQALLQEFGGAAITGRATRYSKCITCVGGGDNGKNAVADVLLAAMPAGTTCAIAPQLWGHEYRRALLVGKHLNVVSELPETEILASESFKAIVTGDLVDARPIREAAFNFRPIAGHYFAANKLPGTNDQTEGFWRRFLVVTFNRSFENDSSRDPDFARGVIATELPAIVGWFLEGAVRLSQQRAYTVPASHHAAVAEWKRNADQIAQFLEDATRPAEASELGQSARDLFSAFQRWTVANGHRGMASNKFGTRMRELGRPSTHHEGGNRYPVRLKDPEALLKDLRGGSSADWRGRSNGYN